MMLRGVAAPAPEWERVASMSTGRLNHCMAAAGNKSQSLLVAGGYTFPPPEYMASTARFDASDGKWTVMAPMASTRDSFGCAVVGDFLVAVGGESANYPFTLASAERLNISQFGWSISQASAWEPAASMRVARQGHSVAALNGFLYSAGGIRANGSALASVERYDAATDRWDDAPPMMNARYYFGLAAHGTQVISRFRISSL